MKRQPPSRGSNQAKALFAICEGFVVMIVVMAILFIRAREFSAEAHGLDLLTVAGFGVLAIGIVFARMKLRPKRVASDVFEFPGYTRFLTDVVISLAFIEVSALIGMNFVQNKAFAIAMPAAAVVAILLGVLPHVLRYAKFVSNS